MYGVVLSLGVRDQARRHGRPLRLCEHGPGPSHQKKAVLFLFLGVDFQIIVGQPSPRWRRPCWHELFTIQYAYSDVRGPLDVASRRTIHSKLRDFPERREASPSRYRLCMVGVSYH
jgi:hypothetical protein